MMNRVFELLRQHSRLGFTPPLLIVDCGFLSLILFDLVRYWSLQLDVFAVPRLSAIHREVHMGTYNFTYACALLVLAPALIAVARVSGVLPSPHRLRLAALPIPVFVLHALLCAGLIFACSFTHNMEVMSGYEWVNGSVQASFQSYYHSIVHSPIFSEAFGIPLSLILTAGGSIALYIAAGETPPRVFERYMARAMLSDLPYEFQPASAPWKVSSADVAPRVRHASESMTLTLQHFKRLSSDRQKSARFLDQKLERVKQAVLQYIVLPATADKSAIQVEVLTSTNRAFEAALSRVPGSKTVVISPYASPSLVSFCEWYCRLTRDTLKRINLEVEDLLLPWATQESKILNALSGISGTAVFILSEVSYATGRRVPTSSFLPKVREAIGQSPSQIIVDGMNAAGNRELVTLDRNWDAYIFGPHRWLLCPARCGVLVSQRAACGSFVPMGSLQPGCWSSEVRLNILAGLSASLELFQSPSFDYFKSRSEDLRDILRLMLPSSVRVVGDQSSLAETFILSCSPAKDTTWRVEPDDLANKLAKQKLVASLLKLDLSKPWVRVTLPYYLDVRDLVLVCNFLKDNTFDA